MRRAIDVDPAGDGAHRRFGDGVATFRTSAIETSRAGPATSLAHGLRGGERRAILGGYSDAGEWSTAWLDDHLDAAEILLTAHEPSAVPPHPRHLLTPLRTTY